MDSIPLTDFILGTKVQPIKAQSMTHVLDHGQNKMFPKTVKILTNLPYLIRCFFTYRLDAKVHSIQQGAFNDPNVDDLDQRSR